MTVHLQTVTAEKNIFRVSITPGIFEKLHGRFALLPNPKASFFPWHFNSTNILSVFEFEEYRDNLPPNNYNKCIYSAFEK